MDATEAIAVPGLSSLFYFSPAVAMEMVSSADAEDVMTAAATTTAVASGLSSYFCSSAAEMETATDSAANRFFKRLRNPYAM